MNILVLNGSPKPQSDTMKLTNAFLKGLLSGGDHQVEVIHVIEKNIRPCTGCFACWRLLNGQCVQQDDQNAILRKMTEADLLIWSFPLYCYGMPSHLKAVCDRSIPLVKLSMTEENGVVRHDRLADFSAKRYVVISGGGFPDWNGNFEALKIQCRRQFGDDLTMICVSETPLLNVPAAVPLTVPLLSAFTQAGREYAANGGLSGETLAALETPVLPNDVYIRMVNQTAAENQKAPR